MGGCQYSTAEPRQTKNGNNRQDNRNTYLELLEPNNNALIEPDPSPLSA